MQFILWDFTLMQKNGEVKASQPALNLDEEKTDAMLS
jgi:hypothetical protein